MVLKDYLGVPKVSRKLHDLRGMSFSLKSNPNVS